MDEEATQRSSGQSRMQDSVYDEVVERLTRAVVSIEATVLRAFAPDGTITSIDQLLQSSPTHLAERSNVQEQSQREEEEDTFMSSMTEATIARVQRKLQQVRELCGIDLLHTSSNTTTAHVTQHTDNETDNTVGEEKDDVLLWSQERLQPDTRTSIYRSTTGHSPQAEDDETTKQQRWLDELEQFYRLYRRHGATLRTMQHEAHTLLERSEAQWQDNRLQNALQKWLTYDPRYTPSEDVTQEQQNTTNTATPEATERMPSKEMTLQDLYDLSRRNRQRYEALCTRWHAVKGDYAAVVQEINQRMCQAALQLEELEEREKTK